MMVSNRRSVLRLLLWQWRNSLVFSLAASVAVLIHRELDNTWLTLPSFPIGIVGGAIGIFVSFRTNSAYARWWEGRKLWGRLINTSRHFASQAVAYLGPERARSLVVRHQAYVHSLRCLLREQDPFVDEDVRDVLPEDHEALQASSNVTQLLLHQQLEAVTRACADKHIDEFQLSNFDLSLRQLLDIQGGCERIKKTPMPRGYGFIAERLVQLFAFMLPLAIADELGWWAVPLTLVVCLSFALISEAGRVLEDPFTLFWNGLPLMALSRMIEVNLNDLFDAGVAPSKPLLGPDAHGILM